MTAEIRKGEAKAMEITWFVEQSLWITEIEMQDMIKFVRQLKRDNYEQDEAITMAVQNYLGGQDDCIYYTITDEVVNKIKDEVKKYLT